MFPHSFTRARKSILDRRRRCPLLAQSGRAPPSSSETRHWEQQSP